MTASHVLEFAALHPVIAQGCQKHLLATYKNTKMERFEQIQKPGSAAIFIKLIVHGIRFHFFMQPYRGVMVHVFVPNVSSARTCTKNS